MLHNESSILRPEPSFRRLMLLLVLSLACAVMAVRGEVKFWDGSLNGNWSSGANWTDGVAPAAGDDLVFPGGVTQLLTTNNFSPNRAFRSVTFQGSNYFLRASAGQTLIVSNGISGQNPVSINTIDMNIVLGANQTFDCLNSPSTLDINGGVAMGAFNLTVNGAGDVFIAGSITGTGGVNKNGLGTLLYNGSGTNTYTGQTVVLDGTLQLFRRFFDGVVFIPIVAIPGDLIVGNGSGADTVRLFEDDQIANTSDVAVNAAALLDLNGFTDWIGALTMGGGTVETDAGLLRLGGNILARPGSPTTSFINGNLSLGETSRLFDIQSLAGPGLRVNANIRSDTLSLIIQAGITKTGPGVLWLDGTNTYNGTTVIEDGQVTISSDRALGTTINVFGNPVGTFVNNDATFFVAGANVTNELLTLNSTNANFVLGSSGINNWAGDITINSNAIFSVNATSLRVEGTITGAGGLTKIGTGRLTLGGTNENTFSGRVFVNAGVLELDKPDFVYALPPSLTIGDGLGGEDADVVRYLATSQYDGSPVIRSSGLLDLNGFNETVQSLTLDGGDIETGAGTLVMLGNVNSAAPTDTSTIEGRLSLPSGTHTFNITPGSANPEVLISAVVAGVGDISKTGGGQLRLAGANTYSGATTLHQGVLWVNENTSLGLPSGAGTILEDGILVIDGAAITNESLTVNGPATIDTTGASVWNTNVLFNATVTIRTFGGSFDIVGAISGSGSIIKTVAGTLRFSGTTDNTYAGFTRVDEGILELNKGPGPIAAIRGSSLIIGDGNGGVGADVVRYVGTSVSEILSGVAITVNGSGLLDLNNDSDDIGTLTLNAGDVQTGTGTLVILGNVTATSDPTSIALISGKLQLNSARTFTINSGSAIPNLRIGAQVLGAGGIIKEGDGYLSLAASNAFTGAVTVNEGVLWLDDSFALGSTASGTAVRGSAGLRMAGAHVPLEALTLSTDSSSAIFAYTGSNSWAGTITLLDDATINVSTADQLNISGQITGPRGLTKTGPGDLYLSGAVANNYAGVTRMNEGRLVATKGAADGAIPGELIIGDGIGGVNADIVELLCCTQINDTAPVTINNSGLLDISATANEEVGSLAGNGRVELGTRTLNVGANGTSTLFSGLITGTTGGFVKKGTGTTTLSGNNTYRGMTFVNRGTLLVEGSQPASHVQVILNATLGGGGTVGNVTNSNGTVSPGSSPATLNTSNLVLAGAANFNVELNGTVPDLDYDQANVRGIVDLGAGTATLNVDVGFAPTEGDRFTIINNDGAEAVVGTFAGLPNGSTFFADGLQFRILYSDIFANDVVLIVTNTVLKVTNVVVSTGNGNSAVDPNECNELTIPLRNPFAGVLASGVAAVLSTETPGVVITQPWSAYPDIPAGATRNNTTPFQFFTTPSFVCGTNIDFTLTVTTATNGTFKVHFSLPSGSTGPALSFNNNTLLAIPDLATVDSFINVAGITSPIKQVSVALHITHTAASDLDISLIGPDGTTIVLSSDNGGTASDYGTDCSLGNRTTFLDSATVSIVAGTAPFVGRFRPEQALAAFNEKYGSDANGTWTLRVTDDTGGAVGSIRCWTLTINGTTCTPADGPCESCGGPIIASITSSDPVQNGRLTRDGNPSDCVFAKPCPSLFSATPVAYRAYTFTNLGPDACVSVNLTSACANVFSVAYYGIYDPTDLCADYAGDAGATTDNMNYTFGVAADEIFTVVVHEVIPGMGCPSYTLTVSGFSCPQRLDIEPVGANRVAVKWSTSGVGYRLLSSPDFSPSSGYGVVAGTPFIIGGKYTVTNTTASPTRFYELRKP